MWRTVAWNLLVSLCQRNFRIWYSLYECEWCLRSDSISHVLKINLLCTMLNHESQLRAITTSLPRWNVQVQLYTVHHIGWPWPTLKTKHCAKYLWFSWLEVWPRISRMKRLCLPLPRASSNHARNYFVPPKIGSFCCHLAAEWSDRTSVRVYGFFIQTDTNGSPCG